MIGTELWYPLCDQSLVDSTAKSISKLLGDNAKLDKNQQLGFILLYSLIKKITNKLTGKNKSKYPRALQALLEEIGV